METVQSSEQKNNLELYLNDVFEKECEFKLEQEEIEFIQTGKETLVQELVDKILTHEGSFHTLISCLEPDEYFPSKFNKETHDKENNIEVYLPLQNDCSFQRYVAENASFAKTVKSTIIKVGSFYDKTKNNFPDEFDFIFPVVGARSFSTFIRLFDAKENVCKEIPVYGKSLHYTFHSEEHQVTRKLDFEKFDDVNTFTALQIQFIYTNEYGERRPINVDLVPAVKFIGSNTQQWFVEEVRKNVEPKTFREEILAAESSLLVKGRLAFTEIEQHFMKNILSKKHVKVYRILKYFVNGHGDDEKFKEYLKLSDYDETRHTSYHIKTLIIYHHEVCANTGKEDLGPCVLQVLKEMSKYESGGRFPKFINFGDSISELRIKFRALPILKSTITTLQSMQISENSYNYERDKIKSVSGQYMDSFTLLENIRHSYIIFCQNWLGCVIL